MAVPVQTGRAARPARAPADASRTRATTAGLLYLLTFAASIPALLLIMPVLEDPAGYVQSSGAEDQRVLLGSFLDVVNALACIGTAVVLFPVLKRQNETLALGFVTSRVLEAAIIIAGVGSFLSLVTLRQAGAAGGADAGLVATSQSLAAMRDWSQLFGPNLLAGVNGLLLGYLVYRSRLVPRIIPVLGLVGGPLLILSSVAVLFGVHAMGSPSFLLTVPPIFVWELSLGVYLVARGFRPAAVTGATPTTGSRSAHPGVGT
jgi:Domain of unknown function (DUF4386)